MVPHPVKDTLSINTARIVISKLSDVIPPLMETMIKNMSLLEKKRNELSHCKDDLNKLKKALAQEEYYYEPDATQKPREMCRDHDWCDVNEIFSL